MERKCLKCKTDKPLTDYHRCQKDQMGHKSMCKKCLSEYYYKNKPDNNPVCEVCNQERFYNYIHKCKHKKLN